MEGLLEKFSELKQAINEVETDMEAFKKGTKIAGTRVRQSMLKTKKLAQDIRVAVLEITKDRQETKKTTADKKDKEPAKKDKEPEKKDKEPAKKGKAKKADATKEPEKEPTKEGEKPTKEVDSDSD